MGHAKRKRNRKRQEQLAIEEARMNEAWLEYVTTKKRQLEEDYAHCHQLFLSLEKHRSEYGFLQEHDQILRDLLEMNITNDVWGVERVVFLGANREKTREMGYRLNEIGGYRLMLAVLNDTYKGDQCELELSWDGIGDWKA